MTDFSDLVAELKAMAIREEAAERRPAQSRHRVLAENIVRERALRHPDDFDHGLDGLSPEARAAIEVARGYMADEVLAIQRGEYRKAIKYASILDKQNADNPRGDYQYPTWVACTIERFAHMMPAGQKV